MRMLLNSVRVVLALLIFYWAGAVVYVGVAAVSGGHAGVNRAVTRLFLRDNEFARTRRGAESEIHCGYQVQIALLAFTWGVFEVQRRIAA